MNAKAPTVTGCIALEPNIRANTKLFHAYMKHKRDAAAMPGLANGIEILQKD